VKVMTVTDRAEEAARALVNKMIDSDIRVELDNRNEKINYKIRQAQLEKIPYMLVIGDREVEDGTVSVRHRAEGNLGTMGSDEFIAMLKDEIANKTIR